MTIFQLRKFWRALMFLVVCCVPPFSTAQVSVTTFHYDNSRSGQNAAETILTPSNVNSALFGKLFTANVDGYVYAQPLYIPNVQIAGAAHNVLYIATEHDSVYAIDAINGTVLLQQALVDPAVGSTVSSSEVGCNDLVPEIGITSTPVIDPSTGTLYVVAKSQESGTYVQRLHALDLATLQEKFGGPAVISSTFQGRKFDPLKQANRPGLLLENGHVVIAWASHCDIGPYQGWVMSYSASTLAQEGVFNTELNTATGSEGGIWMSGDGVAADTNGNLYLATGNGDYNGSTDFGDSILKLTGPADGTLLVADWFTPFNQSTLNGGDTDLGSGGVLLLPDLPAGSASQQLLVQMGKEGKIYLIDRNNMGEFCSTCTSIDTNIVQEIPGASTGTFGAPAFWNNTLYWGAGGHYGASDYLKAWSFNANGSGLISNSPVSQTSQLFYFPTAAPVISANGASNGILWILDNSSFGSNCCQILYAFDATNIGRTLYSSKQAANSRDVPGGAVKFTAPIVADGRVYVGSRGKVSAFGLLSGLAATPVFAPKAGTYTSAQSVSITDSTAGAAIYYTTDGTVPTTSSNLYSGPVAVSSTQTLKAIAVASGYSYSAVATGGFTIAAAAPAFSPNPGTYTSPQSVSINDSTAGAAIYYTTDGTVPTTSSNLYSGPVAVTSTQTLKAMAVFSGYSNSVVVTGGFTIAAAIPAFSPNPGTYTSAQSVSINDSTAGAAIYYTTDGTAPNTSSNLYSGPITVSSTQTLKAMAVFSGYSNSAAATGGFTIAAAAPAFSPNPGTYTSPQSVSINDSTAGAAIYYTTDGTVPTTSSNPYSGPITVTSTQTLKAIAVLSGYSNSAVATAKFTVAASTPAFSPNQGTYTSAQSVSITDSVAGAAIYYTTDGTAPTTSSNLYIGPITVTSTQTLKAVAMLSGYSSSAVATAKFTIAASTPAFSPTPGTYTSAQTVSITDNTAGAAIYYTTDGTAPTTNSNLYSGPVTVSSTQTLKAMAVASGYNNSSVATVKFIIFAATPVFSPNAGTYNSAQSVSITDTTAGATIYYTSDGTLPTTASNLYTGPIMVNSSQTLKAIAVASGCSNSAVATAKFTVTATTTVSAP